MRSPGAPDLFGANDNDGDARLIVYRPVRRFRAPARDPGAGARARVSRRLTCVEWFCAAVPPMTVDRSSPDGDLRRPKPCPAAIVGAT